MSDVRALSRFRRRYGVAAVGAAVVAAAGDPVVAVHGVRHRGPGAAAVDPTDRWHIGSCAKAMTAALYARLVERGVAAWGTPVAALFPDLVDEGIDPGWGAATVDELFTCRAGMRPNPARAWMTGRGGDTAPEDQRTRAALEALRTPPRRRGTFRYSNLGYVVAGAAIDRLAGTPYETALRTEMLEPLGITTAGFGAPPVIRGHRPRLQLGSLVIGRGSPVEPAGPRADNPVVLTPAGRLHLSLADWARFQQMVLRRGGDLLGSASIDHLLAVPPGRGRTMAMGWAPAAGPGLAYGMQGSNTMWAATALIAAEFDRTVVVAANDGRTRVLAASARLAAGLLREQARDG